MFPNPDPQAMQPTTNAGSLRSTLQLRLPTLVIEGIRRADASGLSAAQRLDARLQLGEGLCRLFVALHDEERRALCLEAPKPLLTLFQRIDKPTGGLWWEAAVSLHRLLAGRTDRLLPELLPDGEDGELARAIGELRQLRNHRAHDGELHSLPDGDLFAFFKQSRTPFRVIQQNLYPLCKLSLIVSAEQGRRGLDGTAEHGLVVYRGDPPASARLSLPSGVLWEGEPTVLTPSGRLLPMRRWVAACPRFSRLMLLHSWGEGAPRWAGIDGRPVGHNEVSAVGGEGGSPERWFASGAAGPPLRAPPALEAAVRTQEADEAPPNIPGLRVLHKLGAGGNGVVWLVSATELGERRCALKVLQARLVGDHDATARMVREQRLHRELRLRGVVEVFQSGDDPNVGPWLLMEHLSGGSLAARLHAHGPMAPAELVRLLTPLLATLQRVHDRGIIHRDLKPSNLLLDEAGQLRLIDFGVARDEAAAAMTRSGELLGTMIYGAPEQLGGRAVDHRADLYSVGQIAMEALCGADRDEAAARRARLPPALLTALRRCLEVDPRRRPDSAAALAEDLNGALEYNPDECVLEVGDRLSGEERVSRVLGEVHPGLFLVETEEPGAETGAALVPSGAPGAIVQLHRLMELSSHAQRRALGLHRLRRADDLPYVVLDREIPLRDRRGWARSLTEAISALDAPQPRPAPEAAPRPVPGLEPAPAPRPEPSRAPKPMPTPRPAPEPSPRPAPEPSQPAPRPRPQPSPTPEPGPTPAMPTTNAPPDGGGGIGVAAAAAAVAGVFGLFLGAAALDAKKKKAENRPLRAVGPKVLPPPNSHADRLHLRCLVLLACDDLVNHKPHRPRSFSKAGWERACEQPFGGLAVLLRLPANTRGRYAEVVQLYADEQFGKGVLRAQLSALPAGRPSGLTGSAGLIAAVEQVVNYAKARADEINAGGAARESPYLRVVDGQPQVWMGDALGSWQIIATK